ncbi:cysteine synthase A [Desulfopila sp. IMCC35008]|uniref:cysteine synthase A n=1 Tax=Desulfopila sp. IMCC35008 TaxID=2653858 RepID=UPI0013CFEB40|nr:cysteine synthase A [Desulfopila sp. IMCC35008]
MTARLFETIGNTPLISLDNFGAGCGATLIGKQESRNPLGSVKCRIAAAMIEAAEKDGILGKRTTVVEPTSGNTGLGLAFICAAKQIRLILTMPESMSIERRKLLKHLGAELILTPAPKGMNGAIEEARRITESIEDSFMPNQFSNPACVTIHRKTTAEEIWRDTKGTIDIFVAGVGTGGTITGCSERLKELNPNLYTIAVEPEASPVLSGGKPGPHPIQGIGPGFIPDILNLEVVDEIVTIDGDSAFNTARELARTEGILCGISSGAAAHVAREIAKEEKNAGKTIVFIIPDTGERYLSTPLLNEE